MLNHSNICFIFLLLKKPGGYTDIDIHVYCLISTFLSFDLYTHGFHFRFSCLLLCNEKQSNCSSDTAANKQLH